LGRVRELFEGLALILLVGVNGDKRGALVFGSWRGEGLGARLRATQTDLDALFFAFRDDLFLILKRVGAPLDLKWLIILM
jgi:hypothetical protein